MGQYADVKSKQFVRLLKWLAKSKGVLLTGGGNHPYKITAIHNGEGYPLPASHKIMNKHIVNDFMEWLVRNEVCTKDEFDAQL